MTYSAQSKFTSRRSRSAVNLYDKMGWCRVTVQGAAGPMASRWPASRHENDEAMQVGILCGVLLTN